MNIPNTDRIESLKGEVVEFLYENQELKIQTRDEYTQAGDLLKEIQMRVKKVEEKRKEYTTPLDDMKKKIMADFKQISDPLEQFIADVKGKMLEFVRAEQKRADEEQKRLEAEALEKAKKENVSEIVVPIVNQEVKTQRGAVATTTVKKVWKWKLEDEAQVPREYLCVNDSALTQAVRDGIRSIPGITIYQDEQISIR